MDFKRNCIVPGHHRRIEQATSVPGYVRTCVDHSVRHRCTSSIKPNPLKIVILFLLRNNWFEIKRMRTIVCTRRSSSPVLQTGIGTPGNEATMNSNPLDIRSNWKSLVASCVCVAEV